MNYRLEPLSSVDRNVRRITTSQIEDLIAAHGKGAPSPAAVHEARKTLKRLRALLSLLRHGVAADELRREKHRLRGIAGSLAGARDAHVMIETASALADGDMPRSCQATARSVMALLKEKRVAAEQPVSNGRDRLPVAAFQEAQTALEALPLGDMAFDDLLDGFIDTYRRGRKLFTEVSGAPVDDERFHDLRKEVQQHWRHLQLLSNAWPKALRPQIALAHELGETLGRDHDLSVLAAFVRDNADRIGQSRGLDAYVRLCTKTQQNLRAEADLLARRLYAEKPKAIRHRIDTYWQTAKELDKAKAARPVRAKAMA